MKKNKDNRIEIRLTSEDKKKIKQLAFNKRLTVSAFLMNTISNQLN